MIEQGSGKCVAVIGGGVIGSLTALCLHRLGAEPVVLERGRTGCESSWAGAGILCPIHPWLYPDSFTRLIDDSLSRYPALNAMLLEMTGISMEWLTSGLLIPMFDDDRIHHREDALAWSQRFGWQVSELDRAQTIADEPTISEDVSGSLLWPDVGQARNPRLLAAVRKALEISAVPIREQSEVVDIKSGRGKTHAVILADGSSIEADAVLIAAGSWSGTLAERIGLPLPVEPVKGQIVLLKEKPGLVRHIIKHDDVYMVPRADGHVLVGASMERVGFERGTTSEVIEQLLEATWRIAPGLQSAEVVKQWMGFRPGTPDGMPYLGPVPGRAGLWVASGHYRNGVALAPGTAELMSRWIMGEKPVLDLHDFRVERPLIHSDNVGLPTAA